MPAPPSTTMIRSVSVKFAVVTSGVAPADQEQVDDAARGGEEGGEDERDELVRVRSQPEHLDAPLVLADRLPDAPGRRADRPTRRPRRRPRRSRARASRGSSCSGRRRTRRAACGSRGPRPSSPPVQVVRVLLDEDLPRLGEGERDHRERDPAHPQADRAEQRAAGRARRRR